jgi:hypothetical protein
MAPCTSVDLMVIIAHLRGEGLSTYSIELERLTPQLTLTPRPLHDGCIFLIHYSKVLGFFAKIRAGCGKNNHWYEILSSPKQLSLRRIIVQSAFLFVILFDQNSEKTPIKTPSKIPTARRAWLYSFHGLVTKHGFCMSIAMPEPWSYARKKLKLRQYIMRTCSDKIRCSCFAPMIRFFVTFQMHGS